LVPGRGIQDLRPIHDLLRHGCRLEDGVPPQVYAASDDENESDATVEGAYGASPYIKYCLIVGRPLHDFSAGCARYFHPCSPAHRSMRVESFSRKVPRALHHLHRID
jgi:hypothetical protein